MFDSTGQFLYSFGSNGEGNGQFNAPTGKFFKFFFNLENYLGTTLSLTGVAVDGLDNIIVCDWGNSRLQVIFLRNQIL